MARQFIRRNYEKKAGLLWFVETRLLTWENLLRLARVRLIRGAYLWLILLPIGATALSQAPQEFTFTPQIGGNIPLVIGLPFSWKMIFWSALGLTAARTLIELRCPRIIRPRPEQGKFSRTTATQQFILQQTRNIYRDLSPAFRANECLFDLYRLYGSNYEHLLEYGLPKPRHGKARISPVLLYELAELAEFEGSNLEQAYEHLHWYANGARLTTRWVSAAFLSGGAAAALYALSEAAMYVWRY